MPPTSRSLWDDDFWGWKNKEVTYQLHALHITLTLISGERVPGFLYR